LPVDEPGGTSAKKSLGQHFLVSPRVAERIVEALAPRAGELLFEIGPGRGALTALLAGSGAHIVAYEIDRSLVASLVEQFGAHAGVEIVQGDVRTLDFDTEATRRDRREYKLIGNIPYNLTGVILTGLAFLGGCTRSVCMVQREVGERVLAPPGERRCGILSVFLQSFLDIERVLRVRPGSFRPRPAVESVVLAFAPRVFPGAPADRRRFLDFLKLAFSQRRKRLLGVLRAASGLENARERFASGHIAGIDLSRRPEQLALREWFALYDGWCAMKGAR
jgi:16S rRNA (adenine1518-N6/adenine1519-N6)-dimethyltransferase